MAIFFMPSFIEDLKTFDDPSFGKRVFNQIFGENGEFRKGQNDHRYHGIDGGWIRYISRGKTGYRLIYIQDGDDIYLYMTGSHDIEENLSHPSMAIGASIGKYTAKSKVGYGDYGLLLQNTNPTFLRSIIGSLYYVSHHDISLISPYYSPEVFSSFKPFGRFLDKAIEEDTYVQFITLPPSDHDLSFFDDLEARGIFVYFYRNLHAKLYLFHVDESSLNRYNREEIVKTAVVGSSNLTERGFGFEGRGYNEELCYRVPECKFYEFKQYSEYLITQSEDLATYKMRARRF